MTKKKKKKTGNNNQLDETRTIKTDKTLYIHIHSSYVS